MAPDDDSEVGQGPVLLASWTASHSHLLLQPDVAGAKAAGLAKLPRPWVPQYLVFGREFAKLYLETGSASMALSGLPLVDQTLLAEFIGNLRAAGKRVYVRSDAPSEGLAEAGQYESLVCEPDLERLLTKVDDIMVRSPRPSEFVLIQECLEPAVPGHMSNERRVSSRRSVWMIEANWQLPTRLVSADEARASDGSQAQHLRATNPKEVIRRLRTVGAFLNSLDDARHHVEWLWTGDRLWLVQATTAEAVRGNPQFEAYLVSTDDSIASDVMEPGRPLLHVLNSPRNTWKKLERPILFAELGMPHGGVYLLTGQDFVDYAKHRRADLITSLKQLCKAPVVVRCDVSTSHNATDILLPTSEPMLSPGDLIAFMSKVATQFQAQGVDPDRFAFLIANLVRARASALASAEPKHRQVLIDALWGYPDGLNYLPHDSYLVDLAEGTVVITRRWKGYALDAESGWKVVDVGAPFDWAQVLSRDEALAIARWAGALANRLEAGVQLMLLARVAGQRGPTACLPWHFWTDRPPALTRNLPTQRLSLHDHTISSDTDLDLLRRGSTVPSAILIRPDSNHIRDTEFLLRVSKEAKSLGLPIHFEGSRLSHAYYLMASAGATVVYVGPDVKMGQPTVHDKLVRDRIPAIIRETGGVARVRTLRRSDAALLLAQKLVEEALEVWNADDAHLAEELADVLEVVEGLSATKGLSDESVEAIKLRKRQERGGFGEYVLLEETTVRPLGVGIGGEELQVELQAHQPRRSERDPISVTSDRVSGSTTIRIPLVPPVRRGDRIRMHDSAIGDVKLQVAYEGSELVIRLGNPWGPPAGEQLSLFEGIEP